MYEVTNTDEKTFPAPQAKKLSINWHGLVPLSCKAQLQASKSIQADSVMQLFRYIFMSFHSRGNQHLCSMCTDTLRDLIQLTTTLSEREKQPNNKFGHSFSTISGLCWIEVTVCLPLLHILPTTCANTRGYQPKLTFLHKKFLSPQKELWSCFFEHCFSQN